DGRARGPEAALGGVAVATAGAGRPRGHIPTEMRPATLVHRLDWRIPYKVGKWVGSSSATAVAITRASAQRRQPPPAPRGGGSTFPATDSVTRRSIVSPAIPRLRSSHESSPTTSKFWP